MAYTKTEICNMALSHLGTKSISTFGETSVIGQHCKNLFDAARDFVLRDHDWGFAEYTVAAALLSGESHPGYAYAYSYPADCLKVRRIWQADDSAPPIDFKVVMKSDKKSKMIVTNEPEAYLVYTVRLDATSAYDISFVTALSWKLASDLSLPITKSQKRTEGLLQVYSAYILSATSADAEEEAVTRDVISDFEKARK